MNPGSSQRMTVPYTSPRLFPTPGARTRSARTRSARTRSTRGYDTDRHSASYRGKGRVPGSGSPEGLDSSRFLQDLKSESPDILLELGLAALIPLFLLFLALVVP